MGGSGGRGWWVVVTYDGDSSATVYLDGQKLADDGGTVYGSYANSSEPTKFGEYPFGNFVGRMDEIRLYNRTLTPNEIEKLSENQ